MGLVFRRLASCTLLLLLGLMTACGPKMIPNTPFQDTPDTRAILELISQYKHAWEAKDAQAIAALASNRYLDVRENIDRSKLVAELQKDFDRLKEAYLDITVNRITVEGEKAQVDYYYSSNYLLATADPHWKVDSDDRRMNLVKENGTWKVTYGF